MRCFNIFFKGFLKFYDLLVLIFILFLKVFHILIKNRYLLFHYWNRSVYLCKLAISWFWIHLNNLHLVNWFRLIFFTGFLITDRSQFQTHEHVSVVLGKVFEWLEGMVYKYGSVMIIERFFCQALEIRKRCKSHFNWVTLRFHWV